MNPLRNRKEEKLLAFCEIQQFFRLYLFRQRLSQHFSKTTVDICEFLEKGR